MLCQSRRRKRKILSKDHSFWLLPCLCIALGAGGGILFSLLGLPTLLNHVFQLRPAAVSDEYTLFSSFALCARFPIFLYLISFSKFAPALISCTLFLRGFLLSYAICGYTVLYGAAGLLAGLQLNLYHGILMLPFLLLLAGWGMARTERLVDGRSLCIGAVTLAVSFAAAIPEACLTPWITGFFTSTFDFLG